MLPPNALQVQDDADGPLQTFRANTQPIFVLGSVRSGTTALGRALREGADIPGEVEGHATTLMQMLFQTLDRVTSNFPSRSQFLINSMDPEDLRSHIRSYFLEFFSRQCPTGMWADKSPDDFEGAPAIRSAPTLLEMFPNARFIYCQRRGIENVLSRLDKFPQVPFWYHCQSWAGTVVAWHEVRKSLGDRWIEVRQEDMGLKPREVADELGQFLGLDTNQVGGIYNFLTANRPEQTGEARESRQVSLAESGWSEGNQANFLQTCGQAMELAGYSVSGDGEFRYQRTIGLVHVTNSEEPDAPNVNVSADRHVSLSDAEFSLTPPEDGTRAELRYPNLELTPGTFFRAAISLISATSQRVWFGVEVATPSGPVVAELRREIVTGQVEALELHLPDLPGTGFTVTLWTQTEPGVSVGPVDAKWNTPTFFLPSN
jgi:hypothetical protein